MNKKLLGFVFLLTASFLYCSEKTEKRNDIVSYRAFILEHWKADLKFFLICGTVGGAVTGAVRGEAVVGGAIQGVLGGVVGGAIQGVLGGALRLALIKYVMKD